MSQQMGWQTLTGSGPELFERFMVPALFRPLALDLLSRCPPQPGDRVLDLACGTGVVARLVAERIGSTGRVVGLDISPAMLEVARSVAAATPIEWLEGSAANLPFPDQSFDLALCQQGLQYFPDRPAALRELRRVLAPGGRLGVSVLFSSPAHEALADGIAQHVGQASSRLVLEPFVLSDADEIRGLFESAGFTNPVIERTAVTTHFTAPQQFPTYMLASRFPTAISALSEASREALLADLLQALAPFTDSQTMAFRMETHLVTVRS